MNRRTTARAFGPVLVAFVTLVSACFMGCGKTKQPDRSAAAAKTPQAPGQQAEQTPAAAANPNLQQAEDALKSKDYEKATVSLLQMQMTGRPMTLEENMAYSRRMRDLQTRLAEAAERGDARAQAAIELLRRSRSP